MTVLAWHYGALALLLGLLALVCLRRGWRATVIPIALVAVYIALPASMTKTLGHPVPVWAASDLPSGEAQVLWVGLAEGDAIRLLLDGDPPRYVELEWNQETASELYEAMQQAQEGGGTLVATDLASLYERSLDDREPVFHAAPQPALPAKEAQP